MVFQPDVAIPAELRIAMEEFADAVRGRDAAGVLAKFSRQAGVRYADTRKGASAPQTIAFKRVESELKAKKGELHELVFGTAGLFKYVSGEHWGSWAAISTEEFAPRGVDPQQVRLHFRREGEAWLVDAIFFPAAVRGR